jgi:putative ABC transport system permease protein
MNLRLTIRVAARALAKNKMRASLTVLGIVIGIAAVIAMVSLGQSASAMVQQQFESLGTNVVVVFPGSQQQGGVRQGMGTVQSLVPDDAVALVRHCPTVLAASPIVMGVGQVIYGNSNWAPNELLGVNETYLTIRNWALVRGAFFTERDINASAKVCVIGHTLVEKLFQTTDPIGQTIRIKRVPFTVIGVLERKGANMVGQDQDNIVMAPFTTVKKRLSGSTFNNVDFIVASARSTSLMSDAQNEIRMLLHERHHIHPGDADDFTVRDTAEIARMFSIVTGVMTMLLASIAGVSLLVGGVGIMNIMLVSVTERTREIGIRMAVGARGRDILRQFLIESVLLSAIGGAVGVAVGIGVSAGITTLINAVTSGTKWPLIISRWAIVLAMVVASAVGIFFGYYPARKASKLDPIFALRYE